MCTTMFAQTISNDSRQLSKRERSIVFISAFTAQGNMPKLEAALHEGLNAGITISEAKEVLVQLYAYAGFPRSLNALHKLMAVLDERKKNNINDEPGRLPSPYPAGKSMLETGTENQTKLTGKKIEGGVYAFSPAIDQFLKEHLFGAIFGRDILDWKTREIVTISALAAMPGVEPQLVSHINVGLYNGLNSVQLNELVDIIETNVDRQRGNIARLALQSVLDHKPFKPANWPHDLIFPQGQPINNENFTGAAWLSQLIQGDSTNNIQVGNVTFEPGARTKWHYHPDGQVLLVTAGTGYYQEQGSTKRILRKGDVVKCPPNLPHWHGASIDDSFIQVAITSSRNGPTVWLQPVSEEEYKH